MKFQEALQVIQDNYEALSADTLSLTPPHRILGTIIAPQEGDLNVQSAIFEKSNGFNYELNKELLLDMNLLNENLAPYVVILMGGNNLILPLFSYIATHSG